MNINSYLSNVLFAFVLYPAKNGILYYSIYMATVMARERYMAVRCPVKYHNENSGQNPWRRALVLSLPVLVLSTLFILPVFFEARLDTKNVLMEAEREVGEVEAVVNADRMSQKNRSVGREQIEVSLTRAVFFSWFGGHTIYVPMKIKNAASRDARGKIM